MPFAIYSRDTFTALTGLGPDMKVLSIGSDYALAIQVSRCVETTVTVVLSSPQHARSIRAIAPDLNTIIADYAHQPFRTAKFDLIISYHASNSITAYKMPTIFSEVRRLLKDKSRFALQIRSLKPMNKAQSSHLMLLNILERTGQIHLHKFDAISKWLEEAGFEDITMELINSQIAVPDNWVRLHIKKLDEIIKKYTQNNMALPKDLDKDIESYKAYVIENGEELISSIHFCAKYNTSLCGIDIIKKKR